MLIPDFDFVLNVNAFVVEDTHQRRATDIYRLASQLHKWCPEYEFDDIVTIIELAVIAAGGAAVWEK